jgi:hypothetical protein
MIFAPTNIRTIEKCESEEIRKNEPFPETPEPPDLCDVILDTGLEIVDVYVQIDKQKNGTALQLYRKVHPIIEFKWWRDKSERVSYMGYEQVATIYTQNCVIIKKL